MNNRLTPDIFCKEMVRLIDISLDGRVSKKEPSGFVYAEIYWDELFLTMTIEKLSDRILGPVGDAIVKQLREHGQSYPRKIVGIIPPSKRLINSDAFVGWQIYGDIYVECGIVEENLRFAAKRLRTDIRTWWVSQDERIDEQQKPGRG